MASLPRFSDISEEEPNALIQKVIPEKTKIKTEYGMHKTSKIRKIFI